MEGVVDQWTPLCDGVPGNCGIYDFRTQQSGWSTIIFQHNKPHHYGHCQCCYSLCCPSICSAKGNARSALIPLRRATTQRDRSCRVGHEGESLGWCHRPDDPPERVPEVCAQVAADMLEESPTEPSVELFVDLIAPLATKQCVFSWLISAVSQISRPATGSRLTILGEPPSDVLQNPVELGPPDTQRRILISIGVRHQHWQSQLLL
jgi:hypothetical protein